ncbi:Uncharacterized protein HZ326_28260 [Fusarium oxysporum f. sp. albedinis]|nr:Uncharacterized protein HZ326_28260 [Fusarium oxysporum f. sp. albedinis]
MTSMRQEGGSNEEEREGKNQDCLMRKTEDAAEWREFYAKDSNFQRARARWYKEQPEKCVEEADKIPLEG